MPADHARTNPHDALFRRVLGRPEHPPLHDVGPDAEEAYVTIAEQLRAEGEARGRAAALLQVLETRFGPVPASAAGLVRAASVTQLEVWTVQALTAATLGDALE